MKPLTPVSATPSSAPPPVFTYANQAVSINGQSRQFTPAFFLHEDDLIRIEADLMDKDGQGNSFVVPFSTPHEITAPVVPHAQGKPFGNDKYFRTEITAGHVVMQGRLPSGDWKLLADRINQSLKEIKANFEVSLSPITFFVSTPI